MTSHRKILIVAYSGQGHINPALRFANRLINMGAHVTFCTSLAVVQRVDKETIPHGLTFAPFSDGHDNGKQPTTPLQKFILDFETNGTRAVADIIYATSQSQPFDYVVYTTVIPWAARVAYAHGIKSALLWCQSATVLDLYYYSFKEYQSLISSNNDNPTFPIELPGLPTLTINDMPSFLLSSNPKEHEFLVPILKDHIDVLEIGPTILVNSFDELEFESIRATKKLEFHPIGPLIPIEYLDGENTSKISMGMDFFDKPEGEYMEWLNTKPKSSVVFVSFGTIATFSMDQLEEIANGLLEIGRPFLWVIRDDEKARRLSKIDELEKQGMIVGWCSQVVVLSHQAIGCFVMHGGWNSTLESLVAAVPTVVFPQWSDQGNDAKMIQDVWKTGVKVRVREGDGVLEGKEITRSVEMVMGNEEMKRNGEKWSNLGRKALDNGGSSTINLQAFLDNA
uniref:UDP-glycosyltransferase 75C1-like n=1 Tax=Erigeron canadensis TaxID=72917 RepID=UPI001CB89E55|nr:UDP-glycosyltransferase 75C1-like [Erigeron canadensis]